MSNNPSHGRSPWGVRRLLVVAAALVTALSTVGPAEARLAPSGAPLGAPAVVTDPPADGAFLTLHFGRTQWSQRDATCTDILPNTVSLLAVAREFASRGLTGVGHVVVDRTSDTPQRLCENRIPYASWNDLALLRDTYGWSFVSGSQTYPPDLTSMTPDEQRAESCGSLQAFVDHGHTRAAGMFAYPNNKLTMALQADVVSTCFAYGRKYGTGINLKDSVVAPYLQSTLAVNGGACNDLTLPCSDIATHGGTRYVLPDRIAARMRPRANQWSAVQAYRFVVGQRIDATDPHFAWDCTGTDATRHWTSRTEIYCWPDYKRALDQIPANVIVTDPLGVAQAWGRQVP